MCVKRCAVGELKMCAIVWFTKQRCITGRCELLSEHLRHTQMPLDRGGGEAGEVVDHRAASHGDV